VSSRVWETQQLDASCTNLSKSSRLCGVASMLLVVRFQRTGRNLFATHMAVATLTLRLKCSDLGVKTYAIPNLLDNIIAIVGWS
jgi:hypothetical protein